MISHILATDIGGTNSRFALFGKNPATTWPGLELLRSVWLPTKGASSFRELLTQAASAGIFDLAGEPAGRALAEGYSGRPDVFVLAVPGAIEGSVCRPANVAWPVDAADARAVTGVKNILLINDFYAQGCACMFPALLDLKEILPGVPDASKPRAVLGAGTGLGKALLVPTPAWAAGTDGSPPFIVVPSEGGHANFAFNGHEEEDFAEFVRRKSGRSEVIGDMTVTGAGLEYLFAYHGGGELPARELIPRLSERPAALEWLARFYGRACRNFILESLALGGVFIAGGLASHVPGLLEHPEFKRSLRQSETQGRLLAEVPVMRVGNPDSGLLGAAIYGTFTL